MQSEIAQGNTATHGVWRELYREHTTAHAWKSLLQNQSELFECRSKCHVKVLTTFRTQGIFLNIFG